VSPMWLKEVVDTAREAIGWELGVGGAGGGAGMGAEGGILKSGLEANFGEIRGRFEGKFLKNWRVDVLYEG